MKCPKCKKIIPEKSLKCSFCGARIGSLCKKCETYNSVYNLKCTECGEELLKVCPSCKCINFPNVKKCRKCGFVFELPEDKMKTELEENKSEEIKGNIPQAEAAEEKETAELETETLEQELNTQESDESEDVQEQSVEEQLVYEADLCSQIKAKDILLKGLASNDKKIISITGEKGIGKSIVLKSTVAELKDTKITWLIGECTAVTQLSPCGLIQDILLTFFNVTNFCADNLKLKKDSQKFFQTEFPTLSTDEILRLLNILYPSSTDFYENIIINKEKTFTLLKKVFETIVSANKTIFLLDNFNQIDGLSYEFLTYLINSDFMEKSCKFVLTYNEIRPVRGYLYSGLLNEDSYLDISLGKFDEEQIKSFVNQYMDKACPAAVLNQITERSGGNPSKLEQYVSLAMDFEQRNNSFDMHLPLQYKDVLKQRLEFLKYDDITAYDFLVAAAIQGMKFCPMIIGQVVKLTEEEVLSVLVVLQQTNFVLPVSEFAYSFRNSLLWSTILDIVKEDKNYDIINERMYAIFSNYTLSSNSILAVLSKNINQKLSTLQSWTDTIKLASFIGDTYLYIIAQKQCLTLIDELEEVNSSLIKNNIFERLGKLISVTSPEEAKKYLPEAISNAQKYDNTLKEIELLGYLAQCCLKTGDYYSMIECIDSVINSLDDSYELEKALLKERKLKALLKIGNCGQIVNLVDNEILPILEKYIGMRNLKTISIKTLYIAWLKTYQILAYALAMQGSNRAFEVISTMFELFEKNKFDEPLFICKTRLALAFANTVKGDIAESAKVLEDILKDYKAEIMDSAAVSIWNTLNILNKLLRQNYTNIQEELFQVVTFANNVNDDFTKNILKTLLGKVFKNQDNTKRALEIYNEQIIYFAKEKNAVGALLTWYFIAEANLITEGPEKALEVAVKALDVAQSPKINNYYFIILLNKLIAEAYMIQSEYELAKVHIEKAILVARKFELVDLLTKLYLLYGKYLQDISLANEESKEEYAVGASKMFNKARLLAQSIKSDNLSREIEDAEFALKSFCKLNNIELK